MQIRPEIRFTLLGVVGGWSRMFGVLHDTFLALETLLTFIYWHAIAAILITQGWRIILLHTVVQS
jgi:hypothetical protein